MLLGVKHDFKERVEGLLYYETFKRGIRKGYYTRQSAPGFSKIIS
jgi:hypothetical protein